MSGAGNRDQYEINKTPVAEDGRQGEQQQMTLAHGGGKNGFWETQKHPFPQPLGGGESKTGGRWSLGCVGV